LSVDFGDDVEKVGCGDEAPGADGGWKPDAFVELGEFFWEGFFKVFEGFFEFIKSLFGGGFLWRNLLAELAKLAAGFF